MGAARGLFVGRDRVGSWLIADLERELAAARQRAIRIGQVNPVLGFGLRFKAGSLAVGRRWVAFFFPLLVPGQSLLRQLGFGGQKPRSAWLRLSQFLGQLTPGLPALVGGFRTFQKNGPLGLQLAKLRLQLSVSKVPPGVYS